MDESQLLYRQVTELTERCLALEEELAEQKQIAEAAVAMVQVAREELAECRATLEVWWSYGTSLTLDSKLFDKAMDATTECRAKLAEKD